MTFYSFQNIQDGEPREMFSPKYDSTGQDTGYSDGESTPPSTLPTNRYCISVIDENNSHSNATMDSSWASFRAAWPDRPFYLLNPTQSYTGTTPEYATNFAGPSGGEVYASNGVLWIPGAAYSDPDFHFMPVTRSGFETGTITNAPPSDWVTLTGVNLLSAGAKVGLFVDNSGSMFTSDVQISYDAFQAYCVSHSIDIITVTNPDEQWILPFIGMAG